jgi:hypothetical protein
MPLSVLDTILRPMLTFPAIQVAEQRQAEAGRRWPLSGERWVIHRHMSRELLVLDRMLEPIWRVRLPVGWGGVRAVADDLSMVACTRGREVQPAPVARWHASS